MKEHKILNWLRNAAAPDTTKTQAPLRTETLKVAGVSYRQDMILPLGHPNKNYNKTQKALIADGLVGKRVYEYNFPALPTEFIPEPNNPQDPKAIKVMVGGQHIGYVKAGSCAHIHNLLRDKRIIRATCEISGGKSKFISSDDYDAKGRQAFTMETDETPFYAKVTITTKPGAD
ncbi:MAG: HIRAN domain-containing protein [Faecousia sp.]